MRALALIVALALVGCEAPNHTYASTNTKLTPVRQNTDPLPVAKAEAPAVEPILDPTPKAEKIATLPGDDCDVYRLDSGPSSRLFITVCRGNQYYPLSVSTSVR